MLNRYNWRHHDTSTYYSDKILLALELTNTYIRLWKYSLTLWNDHIVGLLDRNSLFVNP